MYNVLVFGILLERNKLQCYIRVNVRKHTLIQLTIIYNIHVHVHVYVHVYVFKSRCMVLLSWLSDILIYFHNSCLAPHTCTLYAV